MDALFREQSVKDVINIRSCNRCFKSLLDGSPLALTLCLKLCITGSNGPCGNQAAAGGGLQALSSWSHADLPHGRQQGMAHGPSAAGCCRDAAFLLGQDYKRCTKCCVHTPCSHGAER